MRRLRELEQHRRIVAEIAFPFFEDAGYRRDAEATSAPAISCVLLHRPAVSSEPSDSLLCLKDWNIVDTQEWIENQRRDPTKYRNALSDKRQARCCSLPSVSEDHTGPNDPDDV